MEKLVYELHKLFNEQDKLSFSDINAKNKDITKIPKNGIYVVFEEDEKFGEFDRIVRIGTHTGDNQLISRLKQHFCNENKDRSIFRKNIGRCFLNKENPSYLPIWNLDTTSKKVREQNENQIKEFEDYRKDLEKRISQYIRSNFSFCVFEVAEQEERLKWESRLISTLARCPKPSESWLGNSSPIDKIVKSGLWQVNELYKDPLSYEEFAQLSQMLSK